MKKIVIYISIILITCFIATAYHIKTYSKLCFDTPSDVALVLGAGTHNGQLSNVYKQRAQHAIDLLQNKKVNYIIFTGGFGQGESISDSRAAQQFAIKNGIKPQQILIEEKSTLTFYNIKHAKHMMVKNKWSSALLVSDPYHMKRSMDMCQIIGINALPSPTPTSMYRSKKTKFIFLLKESFNYWVYLIIGQHRSLE